jgi:hypothetical protein
VNAAAWRPLLRALIETVLAFDHPAFPAIGVDEVEQRLLAYFPLAASSEAALRAALMAFDEAFAGEVGAGARFAAAPLAARRATLRLWAVSDAPARRRFYKNMKSMVLIAAYALPAMRRAVGYDGGPDDDRL